MNISLLIQATVLCYIQFEPCPSVDAPFVSATQVPVTQIAFQLDLSAARQAGWFSSQLANKEAFEISRSLVKRRLGAVSVDARIDIDTKESRLVVNVNNTLGNDELFLLDGIIRSMGLFELFLVADPKLATRLAIDWGEEETRFTQWIMDHPIDQVSSFNILPRDEGGPHRYVQWLSARLEDIDSLCVILPLCLDDNFGAADIVELYQCTDHAGNPALGFKFARESEKRFRSFTQRAQGHKLAIVVRGKVLGAPLITDELSGHGLIQSLSLAETDDLMKVLTPGQLEGPLRKVRQ